MNLPEIVDATFAPEGALAKANPSYKLREGQLLMARAVAQTLNDGGALVVEAGTGVGKTFAYLIPALLSGERILVSTATKALQDQIFFRDLPFLRKALGISLQAALLKGRSSYLCPYRLELAESELDADSEGQLRWLARVRRWANTTQSGDMSEMPGFTERSPHLPLVTSTRENCLGSQCPSFAQCYVNKARKQALAADLVVINHHLFFADLQVRESGMAELLPSVRAVVIDEAHQFNETGVNFLGEQWSNSQLLDFARETLRTCNKLARGLGDWAQLVFEVDEACKQWMRCVGEASNLRLNWDEGAPEGIAPQAWQSALQAQADALHALHQALQTVKDSAPELARLEQRCHAHWQKARLFAGPARLGRVRWMEIGQVTIRMVESPLDIAEDMRAHWRLGTDSQARDAADASPNASPNANADGHAPQADLAAATPALPAPSHAWIFTSATLGADASLSHFTQACGLEAARILQVPSPFDFARQSMLYVPSDMPEPSNAQAHGQAVAELAAQGALALGGRTLVLTTTLKALRLIGDALRAQIGSDSGIEVLVQGDESKQRLMQRFRQPASATQHGRVLVASATFWEGFDVPGNALQLVVIDKLPFPPPHDPLVQARARRYESQGENAFARLFVPEAAIALKQGAGRLIRTETDKGILVLCDPRIVHKGYGRQLLANLPPMARMRSRSGFAEAVRRLAARNQQDADAQANGDTASGGTANADTADAQA
ncbi:ATP-dependent DNA helicase [Vandammella animalimorsus]|uniref:ATP-dependent DNA helicase n=1 Tax=Vandammella animalimorsus TaxID=2029117 RepID=A0A3M6RIQ7_9BURK|nr:ATP-dependent DNA helicase [Vandammella animalimorsus]RMX15335.1 ATP-dependent DNA helicase [Vandammella animalimorsus]